MPMWQEAESCGQTMLESHLSCTVVEITDSVDRSQICWTVSARSENCQISLYPVKRNKGKKPAIAVMHGSTAWSDLEIRSFSVNVLPSWLRNADQWKQDYRVVTDEKPRK